MRELLYAVYLIAAVTALLQPRHYMAAADFKEIRKSASQNNMTYGCIGLRCLVADEGQANLFMDPHGLSRILAAADTYISAGALVQKQPAVHCPLGEGYSKCLTTEAEF
ncbi:hypothetical protein VNO77_21379 [Canavalia gladiata]|uniref:Uncharacterized protein n=1 Tax=Canavalia gladiata TaxID=3824 RepID=A0AAN9QM20_CANGL